MGCACADCQPDDEGSEVTALAEQLAEVNFRMRLLDEQKSRLLQRWQRLACPTLPPCQGCRPGHALRCPARPPASLQIAPDGFRALGAVLAAGGSENGILDNVRAGVQDMKAYRPSEAPEAEDHRLKKYRDGPTTVPTFGRFSREQVAAMLKLHESGLTLQVIGQQVGVSAGRVGQLLARLKSSTGSSPPPPPSATA